MISRYPNSVMGVTVRMSIPSVSDVFYTIIMESSLSSPTRSNLQRLRTTACHTFPCWSTSVEKTIWQEQSVIWYVCPCYHTTSNLLVWKMSICFFSSFAKLLPITTDVSGNESQTDNQNRHLACKGVLELLPCQHPILLHSYCFSLASCIILSNFNERCFRVIL